MSSIPLRPEVIEARKRARPRLLSASEVAARTEAQKIERRKEILRKFLYRW